MLFMQNSQITFWLELAKILVPSLVALIVPILAAVWLSKKTENYKAELSAKFQKEIESFKSALQLENYEYQTRYSLLQQQKAKAVGELYELISKTEIALEKIDEFTNRLENSGVKLKKEEIKIQSIETSRQAFEQFHELDRHYRSTRIYFDSKTCAEIEKVILFLKDAITRNVNHVKVKIGIIEGFNELFFVGEDQGAVKRQMLENKIKITEMVKKLKPLKLNLEESFRQLIKVENTAIEPKVKSLPESKG
jgi:gamma-glutamylcyclotransferase (GGCT)/AIG2-like uncharacterized protein YtfP